MYVAIMVEFFIELGIALALLVDGVVIQLSIDTYNSIKFLIIEGYPELSCTVNHLYNPTSVMFVTCIKHT
jgi:hypothetical protein